ncbi:putative capsular polysaccharide synthesis family protein [Desulfosarcina sp.]|uniref:putative capsular polysaccharide synthesis family protein n=1 Tax=Desulfosarcina sp. TaxID=2027861 RepID=UPI003970EC07
MQALDRVIRDAYPQTRYIPEHLIAGEFLRPRVPRGPRPCKWPVITLVRDPIARNVSSFFQDLTTRHTHLDYAALLAEDDVEGNARRLIDTFLIRHDHQRPLKWFDMELKRVFDIDIFAEPFDKEKGFTIYGNDRCRVLLIKLEALDRCAAPAFQQFLNTNAFKLPNENVSAQKDYGRLYDAVRKSIHFPDDFIDRMYTSRLVQHLYTDDEIAGFRRRWRLPV